MNFGLPGSAGSVPTVLHDATDTGIDYILKQGSKGAKMMPRDFIIQQKSTQPGRFEDSFSLNFAFPGHHFGGAQGPKMMPRDFKTQQK